MNRPLPRLLAAAKEFNIGQDTLVEFLARQGFNRDEFKPTAKLTEAMYNALEDEFVENLAVRRIEQCLATKDTYLDLGNCGLTDESFNEGGEIDLLLKQCTHVETLIISNKWFDFENKEWIKSENKKKPNFLQELPKAISSCKALKKLICSGGISRTEAWNINNVSLLAHLTYLTDLDLSNNQLTEIKGLESLSALTELDLSNNQLTEIKGLESLSALTKLDLSNNQLTEIKGLESLSALTKLDLSDNQLTEIKGLESLSALTELYLYNNQLTEIKGLESLSALTELDLSNNQLTEIKGLESLSALTELDLSNNQLTEIKGLESLSALTVLYLSNNQLTEIKGLESLSALTELYLFDNQLTEIKGLESLSALTKLDLSNNQLTEIKGLEFILDKQDNFYLSIYNERLVEHYQIKLIKGENHAPFIRELLRRQKSENKRTVVYPLKVLLLGNHATGKSSLVNYLAKLPSTGSTHILRIENYWLSNGYQSFCHTRCNIL